MNFLGLFQPVEALFQFWKTQDQVEMKSIFEDLMDHLNTAPISELNLKSIADNFVKARVETIENTTEINDDELGKLTEEEMDNLNSLYNVLVIQEYWYFPCQNSHAIPKLH